MNKKITLLFTLILFTLGTVHGQTLFDWDHNAVDLGDTVTETIDGITVTTAMTVVRFDNLGGVLGSTDMVPFNGNIS